MQTTTPDQILNHPMNTSPSKQQYSFCKASRFSNKPPRNCDKGFYEYTPAFEKRSTSFGLGERSDFTTEKGRGVPAPWNYKLPQTFDKAKNSGFTFGISREECRKRVVETHFIADASVPGPGSYTPIQRVIGTEGSKWSLRPRTISPMESEVRIKKVIPGPGSYQPKLEMDNQGIYYISKFVNSQAKSFTPKQLGRFGLNAKEAPGPGAYEVKTTMSKDGNQFISKFPSAKCIPFSKSERKFYPTIKDGYKKDLEIPGPGSYRTPSEFGVYETPYMRENMPERSNSVSKLKRQDSALNPGKRAHLPLN